MKTPYQLYRKLSAHVTLKRSVAAWVMPLFYGLTATLIASPALSQSAPESAIPIPADSPRPLQIATRLLEPDTFVKDGQIAGFSVDIADSLLSEIQREVTIETHSTTSDVLNAIRVGQADLGLGTIAITRQREEEFDFSIPILYDGLGIMTRSPEYQSIPIERELMQRLFDPDLVRLVGIVALLLLIQAHVLWLYERKKKEGIITSSSYIPGIFETLWWSILALTGQDISLPQGPLGRIISLCWLFIGIIFIANVTAVLTAELTVQEIQGNIQKLGDLEDRPVAAIANTDTISYLQENNIQDVREFSNAQEAYKALMSNEVDAIVASQNLLRYHANINRNEDIQLVETSAQVRFYAIALPANSSYREPINRAILAIREDGTYARIYQKWFGDRP